MGEGKPWKILKKASLSPQYLLTNSTTHEWAFGAIAELVDNSRDARATRVDIFTSPAPELRGGYWLNFLDNGLGMSPTEAFDAISFGKSVKKYSADDNPLIGKFGNGLKSGSMRIAKDCFIITKKNNIITCVLLSRSMQENELMEEIVVPLPSFHADSLAPYTETDEDVERHHIEMEAIHKYSPFESSQQLFDQFGTLKKASGTLILLYNLKILENGVPELKLHLDGSQPDLVLTEMFQDKSVPLERRSLRAYLSILYSQPRMSIFIEQQKVSTKHLVYQLFKPRAYELLTTKFKARAQNEMTELQREIVLYKDNLAEAESNLRHVESLCNRKAVLSVDERRQLTDARRKRDKAQEETVLRENMMAKLRRDVAHPKKLLFTFGLNLHMRTSDGIFIYNAGRLIKMDVAVGPQREGGLRCKGVVGVVDVPYLILEPAHNKQDFTNEAELKHLLRDLGEHMDHYWRTQIEQDDAIGANIPRFWEKYGYLYAVDDPPVDGAKNEFLLLRMRETVNERQCDRCLKWRFLSFSPDVATDPEWCCAKKGFRCEQAESFPAVDTLDVKLVPRAKKAHDLSREGKDSPKDAAREAAKESAKKSDIHSPSRAADARRAHKHAKAARGHEAERSRACKDAKRGSRDDDSDEEEPSPKKSRRAGPRKKHARAASSKATSAPAAKTAPRPPSPRKPLSEVAQSADKGLIAALPATPLPQSTKTARLAETSSASDKRRPSKADDLSRKLGSNENEEELRPLLGYRVSARHQGKTRFGTVTGIDDDRCHIKFEDGSTALLLPTEFTKLKKAVDKDTAHADSEQRAAKDECADAFAVKEEPRDAKDKQANKILDDYRTLLQLIKPPSYRLKDGRTLKNVDLDADTIALIDMNQFMLCYEAEMEKVMQSREDRGYRRGVKEARGDSP